MRLGRMRLGKIKMMQGWNPTWTAAHQMKRKAARASQVVMLGALSLVLSLSLASSAGAALFTLDSDVAFSDPNTGASGTVRSVTSVDLGSAVCAAGSCDSASQDLLLFSVDVGSAGLRALNVSFTPSFPALPPGWTGIGFLDGSGDEPAASLSPATVARFEWTNLTGASEILFAAAAPGDLADGVGITLALSPVGGVTLPNEFGTVVVVPEPGSAVLLGLGMLALAAPRRKNS